MDARRWAATKGTIDVTGHVWSAGRGGRGLLAVAAVMGATGTGCFALPFVVLPTRVSVGGGGGVGSIPASTSPGTTTPVRHGAAPALSVRAAVHPLGGVTEERHRVLDIGFGYTLDRLMPVGRPAVNFQGGYVEVGVHPWRSSVDSRGALGRLSFAVAPEVLAGSSSQCACVGGGVTVAARIELVGPVAGPFAGAAAGEATARS